MSHIFSLGDMDNFSEKIDLDDLYEKKREYDLSKLEIFNKLLNRIHTKIKMTSRQHIDNQFCWFVVPEMMLGIPRYNHGECVAYLVDKLQNNGFYVKYTHPNLLLISWKHWIPGYVRSEIKKKTDVSIDGYGNIVREEKDKNNPGLLTDSTVATKEPIVKSTDEKKSIGIYSLDFFKNLKD